MERNLELIRELLFYFEAKDTDAVIKSQSVKIQSYADNLVLYHLKLLYQAGFLSGESSASSSNPQRIIDVYPCELTWDGHEYLDSIRDEEVWEKVRNLGPTIGGFTFSMIKELGMTYAKMEMKRLFGTTPE